MKTKASYTLLYVEDEAYVREAAVMFLEEYFADIYEAGDGKEALEVYHDKHPDIIITDIKMPKMDGLALCEAIRKKDKKTPIIIMTAFTDTDYLLKATELNLVKYLLKPIEEISFIKAIERCFSLLDREDTSIIKLADGFIYDTLNHALSKDKELVKLTAFQVSLLDILVKNKGNMVSYRQLENSIWYDSAMSQDALRCLVRDIRKKTSKVLIENISKMGYKVCLDG
jgi:DNA-binding response OmpR family regulator